ncbi:MAG: M56 family metallopeptidase [Acidobacteriota bacterium]
MSLALLSSVTDGDLPWLVLGILLKVTLLFALGGLAATLARRTSAARRHLAWSASLMGAIVLPAVVLLGPTWEVTLPLPSWVPVRTAPTAAIPASHVGDEHRPALQAGWTAAGASLELPDRVVTQESSALGTGQVAPASTWSPSALGLCLGAWAVGALVLLGRLALSHVRAHRLVRRARPVGDGTVPVGLTALADLSRTVRLRESDDVSVPMTCGTLRPVVVLPTGFASWSEDRRELVLLHELAHVKRLDCLTQAIAKVSRALYWFHPLSWFAERQLRHEAEHAADDRVLAQGTRASDYAEHLLAIVRSLSPRRSPSMASVSMSGSSIEKRLSAILDPNRSRRSALGLFGLVALVGLISLGPLGTVRIFAAPEDKSDRHQHLHELIHEHAENAWHHLSGSSSPETGGQWYSHAMRLHDKGHYEQAVEGFRTAAEKGYKPATSTYNVACGLARLGRTREAVDTLNDARARGFEMGSYLEKDADLFSLRGDRRFESLRREIRSDLQSRRASGEHVDDVYGDTMTQLRDLRAQGDGASGDDWYSVGYSLHEMGQYDEAIRAWKEALQHGASDAKTTYNLACAEALRGRDRVALDYLEQAIELGYPDVGHFRDDSDLDSLRNDRRFKEMEALLDSLDMPSFGGSSKSSLFMRPAWDAAVQRYQGLTREYPKLRLAWFNLGLASLKTGDFRLASDAFQQSHDLGFKPGTSAYNVACAQSLAGNVGPGLDWLAKAMDLGFHDLHHVSSDDDLDNLRSDPRFDELVAEMQVRMESDYSHKMKNKMKLKDGKWRLKAGDGQNPTTWSFERQAGEPRPEPRPEPRRRRGGTFF